MTCLRNTVISSGILQSQSWYLYTFSCFFRVEVGTNQHEWWSGLTPFLKRVHIIFHASCFFPRKMLYKNLEAWIICLFLHFPSAEMFYLLMISPNMMTDFELLNNIRFSYYYCCFYCVSKILFQELTQSGYKWGGFHCCR